MFSPATTICEARAAAVRFSLGFETGGEDFNNRSENGKELGRRWRLARCRRPPSMTSATAECSVSQCCCRVLPFTAGKQGRRQLPSKEDVRELPSPSSTATAKNREPPFPPAMLDMNGRETTVIFLRRFAVPPRHAAATSRRTVKTGEENTGAASRTSLEGPPGRRRGSVAEGCRCNRRG
nr:hypothetical protein Iba_chr12cCG12390 [Ipomoea batatas]